MTGKSKGKLGQKPIKSGDKAKPGRKKKLPKSESVLGADAFNDMVQGDIEDIRGSWGSLG